MSAFTDRHVEMCVEMAASLRSSFLNGEFEYGDDEHIAEEVEEWDKLGELLAKEAGVELVRPCADQFHDHYRNRCKSCLGTGTWPPSVVTFIHPSPTESP